MPEDLSPKHEELISNALGGKDKLAFAYRNGARLTVSRIAYLMQQAATILS